VVDHRHRHGALALGEVAVDAGRHAVRERFYMARRMVHVLTIPACVSAAGAFMVELIEGQTVVCDLTHGRRVGYYYRDGADIAEALVRTGLPAVFGWAVCGDQATGDGRAAYSELLRPEVV
jgi:hypothetical protein